MYYRSAELIRFILICAFVMFIFIGWLGDLSFADWLFAITTTTNRG